MQPFVGVKDAEHVGHCAQRLACWAVSAHGSPPIAAVTVGLIVITVTRPGPTEAPFLYPP